MMADLAGARITADARMLGASWQDLAVPAARLRLAPTLLSGMSFRWRQRQSDGVFEGVLGTHAYELREAEDTVFFRVLTHPTGDAEARLRAHLSLERGVDVHTWQSRLRAPPPPCFVTAASSLVGVRVLTIDRLEAVVAFMGSANNNIKRNMQMVEALCAHFGEATRLETEPAHAGGGDAGPASTEGGPAAPSRFFRFPSVTQLCSLSLEELWALGWGYRAPRLHKLARQLAERGSEAFLDSLSSLPEEEARAKLCELSGVGRKVADCVLLFAYGHDGCVPVDTHCLQLAQTRLLPAIKGLSLTAAVYQRIVCRFHELFGAEHAGWAFMVRAALASIPASPASPVLGRAASARCLGLHTCCFFRHCARSPSAPSCQRLSLCTAT